MKIFRKKPRREADYPVARGDAGPHAGHDLSSSRQSRVDRLENFHRRHHGFVLWLLLAALVLFVLWANVFHIDEVARAAGEVIASSRVQVIQAVDGGVLLSLNVREGDRVKPGQVLARLDQTRIGAAVGEIEARLFALKTKAMRLRAEVTGSEALVFSDEIIERFRDIAEVEQALFRQRRTGLKEELRTLKVAVELAREELALVRGLMHSGDVSNTELLRAKRAVNEAEANLINRKNRFLEEARAELTKVEDEIAQNEQVLARRRRELADSVFVALVPGIVKNIRVTTVGGVLRAGEEIMQIIPVDDDLIIEAKVSPADIARVHEGLEATIRFDPFDYTIHGGVKGKVTYVSADTLKEDTPQGEEIYYRAHVSPATHPVTTTTGRELEILPGMTAQIDIRTGDRALMDFLLKPLRKTLSESFGER
uniref:Membrane fusion protein, adhesin transport system n=1 Tax=Candidatus Kentrum sp. DK TaxID=2126562 RepID=A0A450SI69_9GAMM|nr:MAG: membrane fusion protein, adhesin transport system [Candidatus Kentron sp. DK]VFJ62033.1 MAG: membrane fusion protein, adhesin transport system [Candidatus Kentron sp. DK]